MSTHDEFATFDAAYVLGALSSTDRRAYEQHLAECDICAKAVQELAGMPGMLAGVPVSAVESSGFQEPEPAQVLPLLLRKVSRDRRKRVWWFGGLTATAAALLVVLVLVIGVTIPNLQDGPPQAQGVAMEPVGDSPIRATVQLTNYDWGTEIRMHCSEGTGRKYPAGWYKLTVTDRRGRTDQVGSWTAKPGQEITNVVAPTWLTTTDISSVDVRNATDRILLHLSL
ncbi:anti-sigma factor family protein [Fodinicola acaciae]|uniref:anti-sigma factor family protein n=1 Tax=Fodinicola acaciae TaxID=2681555 RepID=UPI0013D1AEDD|nr:zf-HC2 domain-containing protein [Fodinicola acaciae]